MVTEVGTKTSTARTTATIAVAMRTVPMIPKMRPAVATRCPSGVRRPSSIALSSSLPNFHAWGYDEDGHTHDAEDQRGRGLASLGVRVTVH